MERDGEGKLINIKSKTKYYSVSSTWTNTLFLILYEYLLLELYFIHVVILWSLFYWVEYAIDFIRRYMFCGKKLTDVRQMYYNKCLYVLQF